MKNKFALTQLLLFASLAFILSCEKDSDSHCDASDDNTATSVSRRTPPGGGGNGGGGNRINVCHFDVATSSWSVLSIRSNQLFEHLSHGDVALYDRDGDGYLPANACGIQGPNPGIDCNDNAGWIFPGAPEICGNDFDENCNGDEDDPCR